MSTALSYRSKPGDRVAIRDIDYIFERVDPDLSVFYRAPHGANYGDFMVRGENGHMRRPTTSEMNDIFNKEGIRFKSNTKQSQQRRMAREKQLLAEQVYEKDGKAAFRELITKFYDQHVHEYRHSEDSLNALVARALKDPKIKAAQPGDWVPAGRTVLDWITDRGEVGKRQAKDFMSMTGLMPRRIMLPHPEEIFLWHLLGSLTTSGKPNVQSFSDKYASDIEDINNGVPLDRKMLEQDQQGRWVVSEKRANYARPLVPYKEVHETTFWRHHNSEKTPNLFAVAVNQKAKRHRYGGGGFGERHPFGLVCEIDDKTADAWFLVDEDTGIGMGTAVVTLMIEPTTMAYVGWDLSGEHASTNSFLRTVRHGNFGKEVPQDLRQICPTLGDIRMRPTWLHTDNPAFAHSHAAESALADCYTSIKYMGSKQPTDKSKVERELGTMMTSFFRKLPGATYDIELMRNWGYDPAQQKLIGIRRTRELLDRYCHSRNLKGRTALGKRAPAQMFLTQAMIDPPNVIEDIEQFDIAMGKSIEKVSVYATGIDLKFGHYTSQNMGEIAGAFERLHTLPPGDMTPEQERRNSNPKKKLKAIGRLKYDPDNLGTVHLWVPEPHRERWEPLECSNPDRHGMPEFIFEKAAEIAEQEGMKFITRQQQRAVMGRLYKMMEDTSESSSLKRRKLLGRALQHDHTQRSFKRFIEYGPESLEEPDWLNDTGYDEIGSDGTYAGEVADGTDLVAKDNDAHPFAEPMPTAASDMAPKHRKDAHIQTPRPSTTPTKPRSYGERHRAAARKRTAHDRTTQPKQRTSNTRRSPPSNGRRRFTKLKIGDIK